MAGEIKYDSLLVDNELALGDAISELKQYRKTRNNHVAVDSEGVSLSRKGELTILSVATRERVYIFDVLKIGKAIFNGGLREILEDNTQEKLMFDCRQDSDALWHQFNVKLAGVLDLQLLEIMYRRENPTSASARSVSKNTFGRNHKRTQLPDEVENLNGYQRCLELYLDDEKMLKVKDSRAQTVKSNNKAWKTRPLPETFIEYCVVETMCMFKLYDKMKDVLTSVERSRLKIASGKYVDLHRGKDERSYDHYEDNGFLPLYIIPEKGNTNFPLADTTCTGCNRQFPREEFCSDQLSKGVQKCRVCRAVALRRVNIRLPNLNECKYLELDWNF